VIDPGQPSRVKNFKNARPYYISFAFQQKVITHTHTHTHTHDESEKAASDTGNYQHINNGPAFTLEGEGDEEVSNLGLHALSREYVRSYMIPNI
jgi:hypothetical protein